MKHRIFKFDLSKVYNPETEQIVAFIAKEEMKYNKIKDVFVGYIENDCLMNRFSIAVSYKPQLLLTA